METENIAHAHAIYTVLRHEAGYLGGDNLEHEGSEHDCGWFLAITVEGFGFESLNDWEKIHLGHYR